MKLPSKKVLFGSAAALIAVAGLALAQVTPPTVTSINGSDLFQDIVGGNPSPVNYYATGTQLRSFVLSQGGGVSHSGAPTLTTTTSICGGATAALTGGSDVSGQVAEGSTASTSCVITFSKPFVTAPECFVSLNNVADTALKCSTTTTALTVTQTSASSNVLNYLVVGLPGG